MKKKFILCFKLIILVIFVVSVFICSVGQSLLGWYKDTFGVTIIEILYTIKSPIKGADIDFLVNAVSYVIPAFVGFVIVMFLIVPFWNVSHSTSCKVYIRNKYQIDLFNIFVVLTLCLAIFAMIVLKNADDVLKITDYIEAKQSETHIYEDYYVKPDISAISADKQKNLIYIYMESMETTYASVIDGGYQQNNYIPKLTAMAKENISFSNNERLCGFRCTTGTGWTTVALFASSTGLPFCFPIEGNEDFGDRESFAGGVLL